MFVGPSVLCEVGGDHTFFSMNLLIFFSYHNAVNLSLCVCHAVTHTQRQPN